MTQSDDVVAARALRRKIVREARGWIETPYRHQASLKGAGADCLGLVRGIWRGVIGPEPEGTWPRYTPEWAETTGIDKLLDALGRHCTAIDPATILGGDILLFRWREDLPAKHVAILATRTRMVHAHSRHAVKETEIPRQWRERVVGAFAYPGAVAR